MVRCIHSVQSSSRSRYVCVENWKRSENLYAKEFSLGLPSSVSPQDIPITLTTCKTDLANCAATKCDTLTKFIHLFFTDGTDNSSLVVGQFRGIDVDNPLDSFTITIPPSLPSLQGIINFPNGCMGQYLDVRLTRWGFVLYPTPTFCKSACGTGRLMQDRKTLVIDYSITEGGQRIRKQFIGRKL